MRGRAILLAVLAAAALALLWRRWAPSSASVPAPAPAPRAELPPDALESERSGPREGRWRRAPSAQPLTAEQQQAIAELNGVGYSGGSELAPELTGVTVHVQGRAFAGANLYASGHAPVAVLMDMDGRLLHAWRADVRALWPEERSDERNASLEFWRRVFLREDGALLAIFEGHSLVKLDKHSNLLWKSRCGAHHDLEVLANGDILVLTRKAHVVPEYDDERPILEDFVTLLDAAGNEKRSFSLVEALEASRFGPLREHMRARLSGPPVDRHAQNGDLLHANTLVLLDGSLAARIPAFRAGNLLTSSRPLGFIAVVDPEREEVVWTMQGTFKEQHDPKVLANGNLLLFDNTGRGEASTVLELDPETGKTVWEYRGTADAPFFSRTCGAAERLANGNTLITESDSGRAFEVTPAGEIVWEFWNPERAGEQREFIATLLEVVRLAPDHPLDWLE